MRYSLESLSRGSFALIITEKQIEIRPTIFEEVYFVRNGEEDENFQGAASAE